jgi:hypothetical protein
MDKEMFSSSVNTNFGISSFSHGPQVGYMIRNVLNVPFHALINTYNKDVFGSLGKLYHLLQAEYSYTRSIPLNFVELCLVAQVN